MSQESQKVGSPEDHTHVTMPIPIILYINIDEDEEEETAKIPLLHKKFNLQKQREINDVALISQYIATSFDHLREASSVGGYGTILRAGPASEARLITVGEQPMISLYKITKVCGK